VSSKPQRAASNKETESISTSPSISEAEVETLTPDDEIRRRAYEIYLERGEQQGCELDDWLKAERELESAVLWSTQPSLDRVVSE
jgi:hypothetical protein